MYLWTVIWTCDTGYLTRRDDGNRGGKSDSGRNGLKRDLKWFISMVLLKSKR